MLRIILYLTLSGLHFVVNYYVGALLRPDICNPFGVKLPKNVPKGDKYITPTCRGTPLVLSNRSKRYTLKGLNKKFAVDTICVTSVIIKSWWNCCLMYQTNLFISGILCEYCDAKNLIRFNQP
jgi:hypothetical protein